MVQFVSAAEAAEKIKDHSVVAYSAFLGYANADDVMAAVRQRFLASGHPRGLTMIKGVSNGDGSEKGSNRLALPGLLERIVTSHIGVEPQVSRLIQDNQCLAYAVSLGTVTDLLRAAAAHKPGVFTSSGISTFLDPRLEGGKLNKLTKETGADLASVAAIGGKEWLFYPTIPVDAAVIRGTYADEDGNIAMDHEAVSCDAFEAAAAAHNSGGIVIVQAERIVRRGSLPVRSIVLHHFMVDYIVQGSSDGQTQCYGFDGIYHPEWTGEVSVPLTSLPELPLNDRKVCGRRAAMELQSGSLVNLGIGMPESVGAVAAEEGLASEITLSVESGTLGGVPLSGLGLGGAVNPEAFYKTADILNIYDGGGLDMAVLGMAEVDEKGNVNVSKFGGKLVGPGGFIDISQHTPKVVFAGTFTAGGLKTDYGDGRWKVLQEGRAVKFKRHVDQVTFSGEYAKNKKQYVLIVTERAVFRLTDDGWMLIEIAPGADIEKDVLAHMEFTPLIAGSIKTMDSRIFRREPMGLTLHRQQKR